MRLKCSRCKNSFQIPITQLITTFFKGRPYLCKGCEKLIQYETSFVFLSPVSICKPCYCRVGKYDPKLHDWFKCKIGKYCAIKLKRDDCSTASDDCFADSDDYFTAFIDGFDKGWVCLSTEDGPKRMSILDIDMVEIIEEDDRKYRPANDTVIGYKGIRVHDGILDAGKHIYKLGVPYQEEKRDPFKTDFQDVYAHFCVSIEDVLIYWRDCITPSVKNKECGTHYPECRLFRVQAAGHCFPNTSVDWVSNDLTVLSEVTQAEIIEYFTQHPEIREQVMRELEERNNESDLWERYQAVTIGPYYSI